MAEAILNHTGKGRFRAFSAGSQPDMKVNPFAIEQIQLAKMNFEALQCKNWIAFTSSEAPSVDFVFTVCDDLSLANNLPAWKGRPVNAHWRVDDPNSIMGSQEEKRKAFSKVFTQINWRISIFASLPLTKLSDMSLKVELENISILEDRRKERKLNQFNTI
jgi:arsenate reductase